MGQRISCVCGNTKTTVNVKMKLYTPQQAQQQNNAIQDGDREIGHGITVNDLANGITNMNSLIQSPIGRGWSAAPFFRYEASMCEPCYRNLKPQLDDENSGWQDVHVKMNKDGFYRSQLP
jgi:hypothetical protein